MQCLSALMSLLRSYCISIVYDNGSCPRKSTETETLSKYVSFANKKKTVCLQSYPKMQFVIKMTLKKLDSKGVLLITCLLQSKCGENKENAVLPNKLQNDVWIRHFFGGKVSLYCWAAYSGTTEALKQPRPSEALSACSENLCELMNTSWYTISDNILS
jgi:hypothetical protein